MNEDDPSSMINLTPLLDVLFVILILFIMIAPMLEIDRVNLASGSESRAPLQENRMIKIVVDAAGDIQINQRSIPIKVLGHEARSLHEKAPNQIPTLYHDKAAPFGTYQSIKNAFEEAGFTQIDVALEQ